jgi:hypothetical protein
MIRRSEDSRLSGNFIMTRNPNPHANDPALQQLNDVRHALLRLHKTLLDGQRAKYERAHGRVGSSGELLKLVIENPEFDWLHRLSELIVQIDERTEDKEQHLTPSGANALLQEARSLLSPIEGAEGFGGRYFDALQDDPAAGGIHGEIRELMGKA